MPVKLDRETLYKYFQEELYVDTSTIDDSKLLFSTGEIDSFALVDLIAFIETHCEITIDVMDVTLENLDSIELILQYTDGLTG
jgi:acyl carrier protein